MEIDWKKRIAKYSYGINLETATNNNLIKYIETKIYLYIQYNFTDFILWIVF